jgi:hypothetical protein
MSAPQGRQARQQARRCRKASAGCGLFRVPAEGRRVGGAFDVQEVFRSPGGL